MSEYPNWSKTIRQYSDEMRRFYEKSRLPVTEQKPDPAATPAPTPTPVNEVSPEPVAEPSPMPNPAPTAIERETPAPPFGNNTDGTAQQAPSLSTPENVGETDEGTLVVRLNSARGTIPIAGATVTVFRADADGNRLLYLGQTDENGESPTWSLPTRDRNLSLEPGTTMPYVNYAVQANAVGYLAVLNEGVSVFGGVKTVQRITMLPLPEPATVFEDTVLVVRPQNPENELNEKEEDDGI